MALLLTDFGAVVTAVVGYIGTIVTAVVAQPLLLIGVAIGLLFTGVGLVKRFM